MNPPSKNKHSAHVALVVSGVICMGLDVLASILGYRSASDVFSTLSIVFFVVALIVFRVRSQPSRQ